MFLFQHFHRHKHSFFGLSDFGEFQAAAYLHVIGRSLISIFIPILLLTNGFSISQVILYYLIYHILDYPLNFVARWCIQKIGAKWTTIIAIVFELGFFILLGFVSPSHLWLLFVLAFLAAAYDTTYWVANVFLFLSTTKKKNTNKSTGVYYALSEMASLAGPAIGAAVLIFTTESALIYTSIVILALSIIPLFFIQKMDDKPQKKILPAKEFFAHKEERQNFTSYALWAIHRGAEAVLWPTFIFIAFETIEAVAIIPIIASITYAVFSYGTGRLKHLKAEPFIILGGIIVALFWFLRLEIDHAVLYYASVIAIGLFSVLIDMPMDTAIYNRGKKLDPLSASTWQNAIGMGAKALMFGLLLIIVNVFEVSFTIAMLAVLALAFVNAIFFLQRRRSLPSQPRTK